MLHIKFDGASCLAVVALRAQWYPCSHGLQHLFPNYESCLIFRFYSARAVNSKNVCKRKLRILHNQQFFLRRLLLCLGLSIQNLFRISPVFGRKELKSHSLEEKMKLRTPKFIRYNVGFIDVTSRWQCVVSFVLRTCSFEFRVLRIRMLNRKYIQRVFISFTSIF